MCKSKPSHIKAANAIFMTKMFNLIIREDLRQVPCTTVGGYMIEGLSVQSFEL